MFDILSRMTHLTEHALARLKVDSALNPCLWFAAIAFPFGAVVMVMTTGWVQIAGLMIFVLLPVVLFAIGFLYFMVKSPDKLRSEQYELRRFALELIEEKGGQIAVSEASVEAIANTNYKVKSLVESGE